VPNNLILNQSKSTTGLHFDDLNLIKEFIHNPPKFWTVMSIFVFEKDKTPEVFKYVQESINGISREGEYGGVFVKTTSTSTKININGEDFYKIKHIKIEDEHETIYEYEYVIFKDNKLYSIFTPPSEEFEQKYIKTFKFIKKNE
jgi:effector-binding domain-containing protein